MALPWGGPGVVWGRFLPPSLSHPAASPVPRASLPILQASPPHLIQMWEPIGTRAWDEVPGGENLCTSATFVKVP